MAVGCSMFATQISLDGDTKIIGEWDVRITNIEVQSASEGCNPGTPNFTNTSATFDAKLEKPGDSIIYVVTIENDGTIDATLGMVIFKEGNGPSEIKYETTEIKHELNAGEKTSFLVKVEYDLNTTETPSVKTKTLIGIIEYIQK